MALTNMALAEDALSLSPNERAEMAKLLIQSPEDDPRTDEEIRTEPTRRMNEVISGNDSGLTFKDVFGAPL